MTFHNTGRDIEEYYQKYIELQECLRKSEEERLQLEMKFNTMIQVTQEEEQLYFKRLKTQYKRFMDENRKRQERNQHILQMLEGIESRASAFEAKSKRFQLMRNQYHAFLTRIENEKRFDALEASQSGNTSSKKAVEPTLKEIIDLPISKTSRMQMYENLKPDQASIAKYNLYGSHDLDSPGRLLSRFREQSNEVRIADDILRSIYERNKIRNGGLDVPRTRNVRGVTIEDDTDDSTTSVAGIREESKPSSSASNVKIVEHSSEEGLNPEVINKHSLGELNESSQIQSVNNEGVMATNNDDVKHVDINQNSIEIVPQEIKEDIPESSNLTNGDSALKLECETINADDHKNGEIMSQTELSVIKDNLTEVNIDNLDVNKEEQQELDLVTNPIEIGNKNDQTLTNNSTIEVIEAIKENVDENVVSTNENDEQNIVGNPNDTNAYVEQDNQLIQEQDPNYQDNLNTNIEEDAYQNQEYSYSNNEQNYQDSNLNGNANNVNDNVEYDESGQPIQYDANNRRIYYDENGQAMHYDEETQEYKYSEQYDDQNYQNYQYDENGQIVNYSQQDQGQLQGQNYDESGQIVTYDESQGNTLVEQQMEAQYDENNVPIEGYDQQQQGNEQFQDYSGVNQIEEMPLQEVESAQVEFEDTGGNGDKTGDFGNVGNNDGSDGQEQQIQEQEMSQNAQKANVLELLDTESESTHNPPQEMKETNESDFDFSSSASDVKVTK